VHPTVLHILVENFKPHKVIGQDKSPMFAKKKNIVNVKLFKEIQNYITKESCTWAETANASESNDTASQTCRHI
jgi:hypothetical protein